MGRETYTFKLNAEKLSTTLADTLQNEFDVEQSFFEYVFKENEQLAKYNWRYLGLHQPVIAGEIISTLRNEPLAANVLYLGLAMKWLRASDMLEYSSDDGFESAFARYGFELIYDLGQKDKCWVYLNQLYIYCDMNGSEERTDSYDGCYYYWENDMYKDALNYLVVLMSKLCLDENYKNNYRYHHTEELIGYLNDYKKDPRLIEQAELALVDIRIENEEADLEEENNPDCRRSATSSHYLVAEAMFYQIKEVQEKIKDYDGKILILDSY